jgi:nitrous oxide reductase
MKSIKKEAKEEGESPEMEKEEYAENGDKEPSTNQGVDISEEFQQHAHQLVHKANKHELKHLHSKAYDREEELRKEEMASGKKTKKGSSPETFSVESAPAGMDV